MDDRCLCRGHLPFSPASGGGTGMWHPVLPASAGGETPGYRLLMPMMAV